MKKYLTMVMVFGILIMPYSASATMLNATPAEVTAVIFEELTILNQQVATFSNGTSQVAGATTIDRGLTITNNGIVTKLTSATEFHVAKEICYIYATNALVRGDEYTCMFESALIFDSTVDAQF